MFPHFSKHFLVFYSIILFKFKELKQQKEKLPGLYEVFD